MKKLFFLVALFLLMGCNQNGLNYSTSFSSNSNSSKKEAILRLDTGGHTAIINDIIVTNEGNIISASDDKTIRVWDSRSGKEKRKILGEIGEGYGQIYAIALSPNQKYLAIGGFLANPKNVSEASAIRIYNYQSRKLLKVLKSHKDVVEDLAFSSDGKYLISGSQDNTAKIWSVESGFSLIDTIPFHKAEVYAVKIIKKRGDYFAVTAGYDNKIALYNIETKKIVNSYTLPYKLQYLANSDKNRHIAVCGFGKEIKIYDYSLNPIKTIKSETIPSGLAYSPNGKYLIAGHGSPPAQDNIYSVDNSYKKVSSFKKHTNLTMAVTFLNNKVAVSGGGDNNEIYIWRIRDAKPLKKIEGVGRAVWSIGVNGNRIAWGNIPLSDYQLKNHKGKLQKYIDLNNFKIGKVYSSQNFKRINTVGTEHVLFLQHRKGGKYGFNGAILDIKKNGKTIASIIRDSTNGYQHRCYGFYRDYIISGGNGGILRVYNLKGQEIANLVGHEGEVWAIAIDGDRLVSGSSDQTIRVWDLKELEHLNEITVIEIEKNGEAEKSGLRVNDIIYKIDGLNFKNLKEAIDILDKSGTHYLSVKRGNRKITIQIKRGKKGFGFVTNLYKTIYPKLNIFISKDNDWIVWTPENFYNASKGAEKYIGFHINQGADREALFLDIGRFKKQFFRPDLIKKAIRGEDLSQYAKDINIESLLKAGLPPKVEIITKENRVDGNSVDITISLCERDGGFDNLTFYIDGKPIDYLDNTKAFRYRKESIGKCSIITKSISIPSGKHKISVDATNKEGNIISNRDTIEIINLKKEPQKPNLHLLTISINDYKDNSLDLRFPNNDAKELAEKVKEIGKKVYKDVYIYPFLRDDNVTKENIYKTIKEIAPKVGANDVFVLYVSGHGITLDETGDYYFVPYDAPNDSDITKTGISQDDFKKLISQIRAPKMALLLDTCESGSVASESFSSSIQRFGANTGVAIIAGATSKQNAIDGYKKHGIFTYTVLDSMGKKEAFGIDRKLSINEIAEYVKYVLPDLSQRVFKHKQDPTVYLQGDTTFPIGGI